MLRVSEGPAVFRVIAQRRKVAGETFYHANFYLTRNGVSTLVGVLSLTPSEWDQFEALCAQVQFEVTLAPEGKNNQKGTES